VNVSLRTNRGLITLGASSAIHPIVFTVKINQIFLAARVLSSVLLILLMTECAFLNVFSPSPYQLIRDSKGNEILRDTQGEREEFKWAMDGHIQHELAKDHTPGSKDHDWRAFWKSHIRVVRRNSQNAQWYVDYIIDARRSAGLPEL
jgi:hypothetical protein